MKHIDVYLSLTIIPKIYPGITRHMIRQNLSKALGIDLLDSDIQYLLETRPPKTKQIVQRLREQGFAPGFIAEHLNLRQPTVSYHLATESDQEYVNPLLKAKTQHRIL